MTTTPPKEALERIRDHSVGTTADWTCIECEHMIEWAKAAIPVAEIEGQAMELLKRHKRIMTSEYSSMNYNDWGVMRDTLLTQMEALK